MKLSKSTPLMKIKLLKSLYFKDNMDQKLDHLVNELDVNSGEMEAALDLEKSKNKTLSEEVHRMIREVIQKDLEIERLSAALKQLEEQNK